MLLRCLRFLAGCAVALASLSARSDPAPFDLPGPTLELKVTRGGVTLPAAQVPNLVGGDRLWLKADLPKDSILSFIFPVGVIDG